MNFVKLTSRRTNKPMLVNLDLVTDIIETTDSKGAYTLISYSLEYDYPIVKESLEEIIDLINRLNEIRAG